MARGDARGGGGKGRGNWRMEWVARTLHTTAENGLSNITTADAHTSAASSRLNWSSRRFKWTRPFRRKTKSGFCACAVTFKTQSAIPLILRACWTRLTDLVLQHQFFCCLSQCTVPFLWNMLSATSRTVSAADIQYRGADKSLARPTSRCILFDDENISFDASLVMYK
jgi:hypothetical protein